MDEAFANGVEHNLGRIVNAEFLHEVRAVRLDGRQADAEDGGASCLPLVVDDDPTRISAHCAPLTSQAIAGTGLGTFAAPARALEDQAARIGNRRRGEVDDEASSWNGDERLRGSGERSPVG